MLFLIERLRHCISVTQLLIYPTCEAGRNHGTNRIGKEPQACWKTSKLVWAPPCAAASFRKKRQTEAPLLSSQTNGRGQHVVPVWFLPLAGLAGRMGTASMLIQSGWRNRLRRPAATVDFATLLGCHIAAMRSSPACVFAPKSMDSVRPAGAHIASQRIKCPLINPTGVPIIEDLPSLSSAGPNL